MVCWYKRVSEWWSLSQWKCRFHPKSAISLFLAWISNTVWERLNVSIFIMLITRCLTKWCRGHIGVSERRYLLQKKLPKLLNRQRALVQEANIGTITVASRVFVKQRSTIRFFLNGCFTPMNLLRQPHNIIEWQRRRNAENGFTSPSTNVSRESSELCQQ
jgi:hypothetical protein